MATTKTTEELFSGNGSQTSFPFTIEYLKTSDIAVRINGVLQTATTNYSVVGTNIVFVTAPSTGTNNIRITRVTDIDTARSIYAAGSSIRAKDLNSNQDQILFKLQEKETRTPSATVSGTAPTDPTSGDTWYDTVSGRSFVYYTDVDTSQWVEASPPFDATEAVQVASQINFQPSGSAVTRTVDSKLEDIVSVKDFGATGDGTTNDLAAIHTAIATGAAEIFFPEGTYRISSQLEASSAGQRLIGVGAKTIIKPIDSGYTSTSVVRQTSTNCTIEKIRVEGNASNLGSTLAIGINAFNTVIDCEVNNTSTYAIAANDRSNVLIKGCKVTNAQAGYGIWCQNISAGASLSDITIEDNLIDMSHATPATSLQVCVLVRGIEAYFTKDVRIEGNTFIQCTNPTNSTPLGAEIRFVEGGVIANNHGLDGSMLCSVAASKFVTVDGNVCNNATFYGIEVAGLTNYPCEDVVVSNNTINGGGILNQGIALQGLDDSVRCTVSGNTLRNCVNHGIYVFATSGASWNFVTITGNNVSQTGGAGIYSASAGFLTVAGNVVSGATAQGMFFNSTSNLAISGNTLAGCTAVGIGLYANAVAMNYITISGNIFASTVATEITNTTANGGTFGNRVMVMGSPDFRKTGIGTTALDLNGQVYESWTTASPEGNPDGSGGFTGGFTAGIGSTYRQTNGSKGNTLWVKESGTGNTGWRRVTTSSATTGGTGSAGAGNQYVELNINNVTYKVLHDGTV